MSENVCSLSERARLYDTVATTLAGLGEGWKDWPAVLAGRDSAGGLDATFRTDFARWLAVPSVHDHLRKAPAGPARQPAALYPVHIAHEGLCPAEIEAGGGPGKCLRIGRAPTPFGSGAWLIGPEGLIALGFIDAPSEPTPRRGQSGDSEDAAFADLVQRFGRVSVRRDDDTATRLARSVFEDNQPLPLCLYGTPFRRRIWRALLDLPAGGTASYGQIAAAAGAPGASRAAGASIGANPIGWFIPCHRALAATGRLHNYHWGVARKRAMLVYEQACLLSRVRAH